MTTSIDEELYRLFKEQDHDPHFAHLKPPDGFASRFVPGDGSLVPKAIIVGEAPGRAEDKAGSPFVGPSGKLLDEMLREADLTREEVWITNVLKFRPPRNRTPTEAEISASLPYLKREVALVGRRGCRVLVGLGRTACSAVAGRAISPTTRHGSWTSLQRGWNLFITCHPAWAVRDLRNVDTLRADFQALGYDLGATKPKKPEGPK